jgi:hypothetical protein
VGSLDAKDTRPLIPEALPINYVPPGFLIYSNQETLLAQRFDPGKLRLTGDAVLVAEHVGRMTVEPTSASASQNGVLIAVVSDQFN